MAPLSKISIWYLQQMSLSFHTHTDIQNTTSKPTNKHTFPATHHTTLMQQIIIHNNELFEKASLQEFIKEKIAKLYIFKFYKSNAIQRPILNL